MPRDGGIGLDSLGFFRDPDEGFGRLENPDLLRPVDIADRGVVALLGETGRVSADYFEKFPWNKVSDNIRVSDMMGSRRRIGVETAKRIRPRRASGRS
jgi:hypothetical protein